MQDFLKECRYQVIRIIMVCFKRSDQIVRAQLDNQCDFILVMDDEILRVNCGPTDFVVVINVVVFVYIPNEPSVFM